MDENKIKALEVKPLTKNKCWYLVTLHQCIKEHEDHPDYFQEWIYFDGENWDYWGYTGVCYCCFIHKADESI